MLDTHVVSEDTRRTHTTNSLKGARAISSRRFRPRIGNTMTIVALHTWAHRIWIGNHAIVTSYIVISIRICNDLALICHTSRSRESAGSTGTIGGRNHLVGIATVSIWKSERKSKDTSSTNDVRCEPILTLLVIVGAVGRNRVFIAIDTTNPRERTLLSSTLVTCGRVHLDATVAVGSNGYFLRNVPLAIIALSEIPSTLR